MAICFFRFTLYIITQSQVTKSPLVTDGFNGLPQAIFSTQFGHLNLLASQEM